MEQCCNDYSVLHFSTYTDVNECEEETHLCSDICENIIGSYTCDCPIGFMLGQDNRLCKGITK